MVAMISVTMQLVARLARMSCHSPFALPDGLLCIAIPAASVARPVEKG